MWTDGSWAVDILEKGVRLCVSPFFSYYTLLVCSPMNPIVPCFCPTILAEVLSARPIILSCSLG